jgi:hypothetical protein
MGRNRSEGLTPDLFSTGAGPSRNQDRLPERRSRRPALPKDLPKAIQYLADEQLDWLLRTVMQEARRRGRPLPVVEAAPTNISPKSPRPERPTRQREIGPATGLTQGQMNAVRAAFKAGVPPRRIARQFGLSQSQVRKALSSK